MTYWPGPWTVVGRRHAMDDEAEAWCGHWHDNADEANSCPWAPEENLVLCIVHQDHFDPAACTPCVHELHPAECLRCLSLQCIHLNDPTECERCYVFSQLENAESGDADEAQQAPPSTGGSDPEGGVDGRSLGDAPIEGAA